MLVPLATYPYLIRVLGKETYGMVVFALAIVSYFVDLVSFGFNITATKEVSIHRENNKKISEIVSSVLIIKTCLFLISFLLLTLILLYLPQAKGFKTLYYLTMWVCLYDVIFPIWYFQGKEQMRYITYLTLLSRLTFLGLIFILIKSPNDYLFIPLINGVGALISGLCSLFIIINKHKIKLKWQSPKHLLHYFKDSLAIFSSNIFLRIYHSTNKVIAGAFLGMSEVAYYDLAEKVVSILKIPQNIITQTLFPKISKELNLNLIKKTLRFSIISHLLLISVVILFSKYVIILLGGVEMLRSQNALIILSFTIPMIVLSNTLGVQILIPWDHKRTFSRIIISSSLFYLFIQFLSWSTIGFSITSISYSILITEIYVAVSMFYFVYKYRIWNINTNYKN